MSTAPDAHDRIEPRFDGGVPLEEISFLQRGRPVPASLRLRGITYGLIAIYIVFILYRALANGRGAPELLGTIFGGVMGVMIPVWFSGWWEENKTQRTRYKVAAWAAAVLLTVQVLGVLSVRGIFQQIAAAKPLTLTEIRERALRCAGSGDFPCAEDSWAKYLKDRPDDNRARVTLAVVKHRRGDHQGAVAEFERAIAQGAGGYDTFAFYASSLSKLGRQADAVDWYYSALAVSPTLVDVREALANLLVNQSRHYEALALLQAFDARMESAGRPARFTGQRIAIEDRIRVAGAQAPAAPALRLGADGGHFYAPVAVGWSRPTQFMVDTGATLTSLSKKMLEDTGVRYQTLDRDAQMITADGRRVPATVVLLERLQVGPHLLRDVRAIVCKECASLLGMSALSRFDLQSAKVRGVEFLSLVPRG